MGHRDLCSAEFELGGGGHGLGGNVAVEETGPGGGGDHGGVVGGEGKRREGEGEGGVGLEAAS